MPHPGADRKTITFFKLLLAFPDLLPPAQKVTLLVGLVRAWLEPQPGMAREGGNSTSTAGTQSCPAFWPKGLRNPIQTNNTVPTSSAPASQRQEWGLDSIPFSLSDPSLHSDNCSDQRARPLIGTGTPVSPGTIRDSWASVFAP